MHRVMYAHRRWHRGALWQPLESEAERDRDHLFERARELLLVHGPGQIEVWRKAPSLLDKPTPLVAMRLRNDAFYKARPRGVARPTAKLARWTWWPVSREAFTDDELDKALSILDDDRFNLTALREVVPTRPASVTALRDGIRRLVERGKAELMRGYRGWYQLVAEPRRASIG